MASNTPSFVNRRAKGRFARLAALATASLIMFAGLGTTADAASCRAMSNELRQLERSGGGSAKYKRALSQQYAALKKVEQALRSNRCRSQRSNACSQYASAQRQMLANVQTLKRKANGGGNEARKASLRRSIQNSCNVKSVAAAQKKRPGLFESLRNAGNKRKVERERVRTARVQTASIAPRNTSVERAEGKRRTKASAPSSSGLGGGDYRAVCVRMGDGYYWPAGGTVSRHNYQAKEAECIASCPGQDVKLYIHRLGGETDEMMSARDGSPYTRIPSAHAYRTAYNDEHQCGRGVETKIIASPMALPRDLRLARMVASGNAPLAVLPMPRPEFDEAGNLVTPTAVAQAPAAPAAIRVVGPKFLSDRLVGSISPDRAPRNVPSAPAEGA